LFPYSISYSPFPPFNSQQLVAVAIIRKTRETAGDKHDRGLTRNPLHASPRHVHAPRKPPPPCTDPPPSRRATAADRNPSRRTPDRPQQLGFVRCAFPVHRGRTTSYRFDAQLIGPAHA
jgi:hypothetical protein